MTTLEQFNTFIRNATMGHSDGIINTIKIPTFDKAKAQRIVDILDKYTCDNPDFTYIPKDKVVFGLTRHTDEGLQAGRYLVAYKELKEFYNERVVEWNMKCPEAFNIQNFTHFLKILKECFEDVANNASLICTSLDKGISAPIRDWMFSDGSQCKSIPLEQIFLANGRVEEDKDEFVRTHLLYEGEEDINFYWKFNNSIEYIEQVINENKPLGVSKSDVKFWTKWFSENFNKLEDLRKLVEKALIDDYLPIITAQRNGQKLEIDLVARLNQITSYIQDHVPSFIIHSMICNLAWDKPKKDDEDSYRKVSHFSVGYTKSMKVEQTHVFKNTVASIFADNVLNGVDLNGITKLKVFSNEEDSVISLFNLGYRPLGYHYMKECNGMPTLPKDSTWYKFIEGSNGDNPKFPSPIMGKLRFAYFIYSLFEARNSSRRALIAVGKGNNGKSVCLDAVAQILGSKLSATGLSQDTVCNDTFGLTGMFNKRLMVVDDIPKPSEFLNNDTIKRITGAGKGSIQINEKYKSPKMWNVNGCKITMITNYRMFLNTEAEITRCLPLCFLENFNRDEKMDASMLVEKLVKEGELLKTWAFNYLKYFIELKNEKDEKFPGLIMNDDVIIDCEVYSDSQFNEWMKGELDLNPKNNSEYQQLRYDAFTFESTAKSENYSVPMITIANDNTEDDESPYIDVIEAFFEKNEKAYVQVKDIYEVLYKTYQDRQNTDNIWRIKSCGLDIVKDKTVKQLLKTTVWKEFLHDLGQYFGTEYRNHKVNGKGLKCFKGIALKSKDTDKSEDTLQDIF